MDPVSHVNQVLLLLRKQLAERSRKDGLQTATSTSTQAQKAQARTQQPLEETLVRRLAELRTSGISNEASLARLLLEEVLLADLGRHLRNDPGFQRLLDDVYESVQQDMELKSALQKTLFSA